MSDATESVGARLARLRKRQGLNQVGLAQRTAYSRSYIAQVEAGHRMPPPAFIAAAARGLGVDQSELYGQPYDLPHHDASLHASIPHLRRAALAAAVGPDLAEQPRALNVLAAEVVTVRRMLNAARLTRAGERIPLVIEELAAVAHQTDAPEAWGWLSRGLYLGASLARKLGYSGDALLLLRAEADAARRADDPNLPLLVSLLQSLVMAGMDQNSMGLRVLDRALADVDLDRPDGAEIAGALELRAAILAARLGEQGATRAWDYHGRATERIRASQIRVVHGQEVNAGNAAVHGAAVAVELADMDEATRRDEQIGERLLSSLPEERRAHHEIDMSRALVEVGAYDRAEARLVSADRTAAQLTQTHPSAHLVVRHLVDRRRRLPEPLRSLAHRVGA